MTDGRELHPPREKRYFFFGAICSPQQTMSHTSMQPHTSSTVTTMPHTPHAYLSPFAAFPFFFPGLSTIAPSFPSPLLSLPGTTESQSHLRDTSVQHPRAHLLPALLSLQRLRPLARGFAHEEYGLRRACHHARTVTDTVLMPCHHRKAPPGCRAHWGPASCTARRSENIPCTGPR